MGLLSLSCSMTASGNLAQYNTKHNARLIRAPEHKRIARRSKEYPFAHLYLTSPDLFHIDISVRCVCRGGGEGYFHYVTLSLDQSPPIILADCHFQGLGLCHNLELAGTMSMIIAESYARMFHSRTGNSIQY
jgi:hypothetical protein